LLRDLTYAGVSGTVMVIWSVIKSLGLTSRWWAIGLAAPFAVGLQILSGPVTVTTSRPGKVFIWGLLVLGNTAVLTSAALGLNETAAEVGAG
jgi:hypothetical protein